MDYKKHCGDSYDDFVKYANNMIYHINTVDKFHKSAYKRELISEIKNCADGRNKADKRKGYESGHMHTTDNYYALFDIVNDNINNLSNISYEAGGFVVTMKDGEKFSTYIGVGDPRHRHVPMSRERFFEPRISYMHSAPITTTPATLVESVASVPITPPLGPIKESPVVSGSVHIDSDVDDDMHRTKVVVFPVDDDDDMQRTKSKVFLVDDDDDMHRTKSKIFPVDADGDTIMRGQKVAPAMTGGSYREKYYKYKAKYLSLRNALNKSY